MNYFFLHCKQTSHTKTFQSFSTNKYGFTSLKYIKDHQVVYNIMNDMYYFRLHINKKYKLVRNELYVLLRYCFIF